jgi:hypothetical protein
MNVDGAPRGSSRGDAHINDAGSMRAPVGYRRWRSTRATSERAVTYIVCGEFAFLFFVGVCVALHPGFVLTGDEGGMSNYGLHLKTAVPYTFALAALALCSRRAALLCPHDERSRGLRIVLNSYSSILLLVLLSSYVYSLNIELKDVHYGLSTVLLVLVCTASLSMLRQRSPSSWPALFLLVQLSGAALALLTALGDLHVLFLAEILANVGFTGILIQYSGVLRRSLTEVPAQQNVRS